MNACEADVGEKLAEVRQHVIDTLLEIDDINLQVNPHILAQYAKTIGYLENDLYKWQLRSRRCKRKFALAQASANRREPIELGQIESNLDEEFAEWEAQLARRSDDQMELLESLARSRALSPSETRELKELHRKLIRRLHPDVHPNLPEEASRFFLLAQAAYENGDVAMLRAVDTATEDYEETETETWPSGDDAAIELAMAEAQLSIVQEQLETLKNSHPYVLAELLDDPVKLTERKSELEAEIERQKEAVRAYEAKIAELVEDERQ